MDKYILNPDGTVEKVDSLLVWAEWMEKAAEKTVENGGRIVAHDRRP